MAVQFLVRRGAFAGIVGGVFIAIYQLLHPERDAHSVLSSPYSLIHVLGVGALTHILFGLLSLYLAHGDRLKPWGRNAFVMALIGIGLYVGALTVDAFLNPALARLAPDLQTAGHSANGLHVLSSVFGISLLFLPLAGLMLTMGIVAFFIALQRAGIVSMPVTLLIIPGILLFGAAVFVPVWMETIGAILFGMGFAWLNTQSWHRHGMSLPQETAMA